MVSPSRRSMAAALVTNSVATTTIKILRIPSLQSEGSNKIAYAGNTGDQIQVSRKRKRARRMASPFPSSPPCRFLEEGLDLKAARECASGVVRLRRRRCFRPAAPSRDRGGGG